MRLRLLVLGTLIGAALIACGGDDSQQENLKPQLGSVELVASREGDATVLSGDGPVKPRVVIPDDVLPDGVTKDDLNGSVAYATDPETGSTAVEFHMGPDGTQFSAPIKLSWVGRSGEGITTALMAVDDEGNNLLTRDEAESIVSTLTTEETNEDGIGPVSLSVDHFSGWYVFQYNSIVSASSSGNQFVNVDVRLVFDFWRKHPEHPTGSFTLYSDYWPSYEGLQKEHCIDAEISVSGGAAIDTTQGEQCGTTNETDRSITVRCPDLLRKGKVTVDFSAFFGVPGFAPMEKLFAVLGSTQQKVDNASTNESAFVASSDLTIFIQGRVNKTYDCSQGSSATVTSAPPTIDSTTVAPSSSVVETSGPSSSSSSAVPSGVPTTRVVTTTTAPNPNSGTTTSTVRPTTVPAGSSTTMDPYASVPTTPAPAEPVGTWLRNDSKCRWRGTSTCGIYSSGNAMYDDVGPSGGPGQTYTPVGGTPGELAFNLLSGNSIESCDWNGSGGCGYYYTGTPGTYNINALG
ncbi:MAG: hypothetical protein ACKOD2_08575 [Ilumatobacteraceae bacterium]